MPHLSRPSDAGVSGAHGTLRTRARPPCYIGRKEVVIMRVNLTAAFERVPEGYIGYVEELPGANTQAQTLEEARASLHEAVELVLDANREMAEQRLGDRDVILEPLR
jgi:predicted RNase H-like HicB family nuclease